MDVNLILENECGEERVSDTKALILWGRFGCGKSTCSVVSGGCFYKI